MAATLAQQVAAAMAEGDLEAALIAHEALGRLLASEASRATGALVVDADAAQRTT